MATALVSASVLLLGHFATHHIALTFSALMFLWGMSSMIRYAAVVNQRDEALKQSKAVEDLLVEHATQQEALAMLAKHGLQSTQIEDILQEAGQMVKDALDISCVGIWEVIAPGDMIKLRYVNGCDPGKEIEDQIGTGSVEGLTLKNNATTTQIDLMNTDFDNEIFSITQEFTWATAVVIQGQGHNFGALAIYGDASNQPKNEDVTFLESVAGIVAVAVGRAVSEHDLQQALKLESVGRLAAGIAHEINTPIQFIGDNLHFLRDAFKELIGAAEGKKGNDIDFLIEEVPSATEQALDGVQRVATIVRAMKAFGHPDATEMRMNDVNEALRNTLVVARNEIKYVADVRPLFGEIPLIRCHIGELNQVFLNLLVNASHAIGDRQKKEPDARGTIMVRTWQDKDHVIIAIGDTGCGIPAEIRKRVFDPFFTTKEVGRGTGQGLALANSVITKHGGTIRFDTDPTGTVFCIKLPIGDETKGEY